MLVDYLDWRSGSRFTKLYYQFSLLQISGKRGPNSRFVVEANIKAL